MPIIVNPATGRHERVSVRAGIVTLDRVMDRLRTLHARKTTQGWLGTNDHQRYRDSAAQANDLLRQLDRRPLR